MKKACHLCELFVRSEAWQDVSPPFKVPRYVYIVYLYYTTMSASKVFTLIDDRKNTNAKVAGDDHHECKLCICSS